MVAPIVGPIICNSIVILSGVAELAQLLDCKCIWREMRPLKLGSGVTKHSDGSKSLDERTV